MSKKNLKPPRYFYFKNYYAEKHYNNDFQLHRYNAPAVIHRDYNHNVLNEFYYKNNKLHNTKGAAVIYYNENGEIIKRYFIEDQEFKSKVEFFLYMAEKAIKE